MVVGGVIGPIGRITSPLGNGCADCSMAFILRHFVERTFGVVNYS